MGPNAKSERDLRSPGAHPRRAAAIVRAWDGPNSRIAFELDLDEMPWGPFEALGKKVTLLLAAREENDPGGPGEDEPQPSPEQQQLQPRRAQAGEEDRERALRHVEHAAERCAEFAELGNGGDELWRDSLETWRWLRDFLVAAPATPVMPGAAATLEVVANALRETPLAVWREAVGTFDPDAPTREEAIRTLRGVAQLLGEPVEPEPETEQDPPEPEREPEGLDPDGGQEAERSEAGLEGAGSGSDLSFDYASGYDEGYRMGRRVGRALEALSAPATPPPPARPSPVPPAPGPPSRTGPRR